LQTTYFCDDCTQHLVHAAFNGRAPIYHGESLKGYCGLCNESVEVTMRQWFACGPCWNFVLAYQKSIAATVGVKNWWAAEIAPIFPNLLLQETEPVVLQPFVRSKQTKFEKAASLEVLDFLIRDEDTSPPTNLFHLEQKAGPSSIDQMKEFQLDVNDFNDIVGAMNATSILSYVIHVQLEHEYEVPTRKTRVVKMWWSDLYTMHENAKRIGQRRGEDKRAIFFKPGAFKPIGSFVDELRSGRHKEIAARLTEAKLELIA